MVDQYPVCVGFCFCFLFISFYIVDFDLKYFWAWTDFQSYLDFMLAVWFVGAIVTYFMLPFPWFMESMGFVALFSEAMLGEWWLCARKNSINFVCP